VFDWPMVVHRSRASALASVQQAAEDGLDQLGGLSREWIWWVRAISAMPAQLSGSRKELVGRSYLRLLHLDPAEEMLSGSTL